MTKKIILIMLAVVLAIGFIGCGGNEVVEEKKVVVASKPHSEQYILAEMIALLIETNTDIEVERALGIGGGTANIHPGMIAGQIDIYPEYTGTGWLFVLKQENLNDPMELYKQVKAKYKEEYNIEWLGLYGFNNTYALAIDGKKAKEMGIETYTDLAANSEELILGAEYDFYEREDGFPGLVNEYGFKFKKEEEIDIGLKYEAIGSGKVDLINAFSTDGTLAMYDLKVLEDDKNFFPAYHAATLVRGETLEKYPELAEVLKVLENQISDAEMTQLNYEVEIENKDPQVVAREFLEGKNLL